MLLHIDAKLCSRARFSRSTCARCGDICPLHTISLADGAPEVGEECTGCGLCAAVCPNGAIDLTDCGERDLFEEIRGMTTSSKFTGFSCRYGHAPGHVRVFCLGRLGEHHLLAPISLGTIEVVIEDPGCCSGCIYEEGMVLFRETLSRAQSIGGGHFAFTGPATAPSFPHVPLPPLRGTSPAVGGISRRAFFSALVSRPEPRRSTGHPQPFLDRVKNSKRELLLTVIREMAGLSVGPGGTPLQGGPYGGIEISEECFGCIVCEKLCPAGAIHREENDREVVLSFDPQQCTACRVCVEACLPRAITLTEGCDPSILFSSTPKELLHLMKRRCQACGEEFASRENPLCTKCRKPHPRVRM